MRPHGKGLVAALAGLAVLAGCASPARPTPSAAGARARPHVRVAALHWAAPAPTLPPRFASRLPWPVVLSTSAGRYLIARDGVVRRLVPAHRAPARYPADFIWVNWPKRAWATMHTGHLEIVRNQKVFWRSARAYRVGTTGKMNEILTSRAGIAFQIRASGPWYQARWNGPEHLVGNSGWPEAWTRSGNLVAVQGDRRDGYRYSVYSISGTLVATLATGLNVSLLDQGDANPALGTFWFIGTDQVLYRTDGRTVTRVADLTGFGAARANGALLNVLAGGYVQMFSDHWRGQLIFSPDGQMVASIPAPTNRATAGLGWVAVGPGGRAFAYAPYNVAGGGATVYLVRPGEAPVAIYRTARGASPCGGSPLSWHGSWLLFAAARPVLIDASGRHRVIKLPAMLSVGGGRVVRVFSAWWK